MKPSTRWLGLALVGISALVFSSAGLFVKGVAADAWTVLFWRGLSAAAITSLVILITGRQHVEFKGMGKSGIWAGLVGAAGTIAFIPSFKHTSIANVSLLYAACPFIAGLIMWLWVREKPTFKIILSSLAALVGVGIIVSGSIGGLNLKGDLLALWMTFAMAIYLCIYRRFPNTPAAGPSVLLSLVLVPIAWIFSDPLSAPMREIIIMCLFGVVFSIASVTLAMGARHLPAGETALISALETPLAPIWAWWLLNEVPPHATFIGGSIIFLAVIYSQWRSDARM